MEYKGRKFIELIDELDAKILFYAINHVNWNEYNPEEYDGESTEAACEHLNNIEYQICEEFDIDT